jgi:type I restriction enzyme S subunit
VKKEWKVRKLEQIAYLAGRIGWKGLTAKEYTAEGPLFLSVHSLNFGDYVDLRDAFHVSQERYDESPEIMLRENDILICKDGAGIGKVGIIGELSEPATVNSSLLLIRALEGMIPKFLYYALCSPIFQNVVQERIDGATTPHLYQREIKQILVPHPPIAEQKRIVAILDEAYEGISRVVANAEKNLANARELFENAIVNSLFGNPTIQGWRLTSVENIAASGKGNIRTGPFGSQLLHGEFVDEGIAVLGIDNAVDNEFRWAKRRFITHEKYSELSRYKVKPGDVLITIMGTCGRCAVVPDDVPLSINSKHLCCITLNRTKCLP